MKKKVIYLSIVNSIAIIAVLIGHLDVTGPNNDPQTPIANAISNFGSFQMSLFMCVSGFLFAMTSGYSKNYKELINSKIKRLLIPFLFLSCFALSFKLCLPSSMLEHNVGLNPKYLLRAFFVPFRGPVPHLWFVISLFTMFLLTPILKWTTKNSIAILITFLILAGLQSPPNLRYINTEILAIDKTMNFIIWFYLGIIAQIHGYIKKLNSWLVVIITGVAYTVLIFFVKIPMIGNLITMLIGIVFIFALAYNLAKILPNLFSAWRNYTYQIYLLHMFPIMAWKFIYKRHLIDNNDTWFWLIWICSLVTAITFPTIIAKITERMPQKIKLLIGL